MHTTSATLLPLSLYLASLSSALALPITGTNTASTAAAAAATTSTSPTPGDFKLYTYTYDTEFDTDADAAAKFNNIYLNYLTGSDGITTLVGDKDQPGAPIWTLDGATHTLTAHTVSSSGPSGALVLSNITASASPSLSASEGYNQVTLDTSGSSPSQFSIEQGTAATPASTIAYYGSKDHTLIFGSFVMCQVSTAGGATGYSLAWRGSSKAVWKAPTGCALVKLGLDYELFAHPTPVSP